MGKESTTKKIKEILEKLNNKKIIIEQNGFISSKIFIKNLKYETNYDILEISEENEKNNLKIYLDNDMQIDIKEMEN